MKPGVRITHRTSYLLHSAMCDEAQFICDQSFPYLASDYHLFAVDATRHGKSKSWTGFLDRNRLIEILHDTIAQLELERFHIIGLSMDGAQAIDYVSRFPEQVLSMVLFEVGGSVNNKVLPLDQPALSNKAAKEFLAQVSGLPGKQRDSASTE